MQPFSYLFILGSSVFSRLGWAHDDLVRAQWGTGADIGKLRLEKARNGAGWKMSQRHKPHAMVIINTVPDLAAFTTYSHQPILGRVENSEVAGKFIEIRLPPDFFKAGAFVSPHGPEEPAVRDDPLGPDLFGPRVSSASAADR